LVTIPGVLIPSPSSEVTVWCSLPNGFVDQIPSNDTIVFNADNWPNCNDHCSNAQQIGIGTTLVSQTSNATVNNAEEPDFPCNNPTLENTVWFFFETDAVGGEVTLKFEDMLCSPSTNGIQVSINRIDGAPCNPQDYENVFCSNEGNTNDITWGPIELPANTLYYITIDGYAGSDCDFQIDLAGSITPLPVELTSFNANCYGNNRLVTWTTASEDNSSHFDVLRSTDGLNFEKISRIEAAGNSTYEIKYEFVDNQVSGGTVYYRLQQFDLDGVNRTYPAISSVCDDFDNAVSIFPNPSNGISQLKIISENVQQANLVLYNNEGKRIDQQNLSLLSGRNTIPLEYRNLQPGIYMIRIELDDDVRTLKWVILE
jgi:hypothetical protein